MRGTCNAFYDDANEGGFNVADLDGDHAIMLHDGLLPMMICFTRRRRACVALSLTVPPILASGTQAILESHMQRFET